ncbi:50S ribosomal protein L21 [endosymbiont DhMRE of Dentiscutata heterogama]|uniref:50S ribosomal protein L21 n=1 Tax=endosymbiont DhMRE of Dentiscutata heterogama TaxID=1609546 RepID=UPI000629DA72|nr:50S ribosomal protein L21 [endosymbiont DhMRE of Dentiscutata heterogama]CFW92804.1 50S ribosomal protein L21 [endosymbiont DhMRE of Dentiscutata heterogama]
MDIIRFELKGKQYLYLPKKKEQTFRIDYQKNAKSGGKIIFDKILQKDDEFGQPYLPIKLVGEVIKHGQNKKIVGMKYKPKKRNERKWGFRAQYTEVKILGVEK